MAIRFETADPSKLLSVFKKAIDDGDVITWSYDQDGDFTHTADQWKNRAWLHPKIQPGVLILSVIKPKESNVSSLLYAIYHGRFVESMLTHCDSLFNNAMSSALPTEDDQV